MDTNIHWRDISKSPILDAAGLEDGASHRFVTGAGGGG